MFLLAFAVASLPQPLIISHCFETLGGSHWFDGLLRCCFLLFSKKTLLICVLRCSFSRHFLFLKQEVVVSIWYPKLSFWSPGAFVSALLGTTLAHWRHLGCLGSERNDTYRCRNLILSDLGMALGLHRERFSGTEGRKSGFVIGFVSMSLSKPILKSKSRQLGFSKLGFRMEYIAKTNVLQKLNFNDFWQSWVIYQRFLVPWIRPWNFMVFHGHPGVLQKLESRESGWWEGGCGVH